MKRAFASARLATSFAALAILAGEASACAACGAPLPARTLNAYIAMTAALSLLPMALMGMGWAAWRLLASSRHRETSEQFPWSTPETHPGRIPCRAEGK